MNKLILEDKEYTISDELIEKIKAEIQEQEKKISPFTRDLDKEYFYISYDGTVHATMDGKLSVDDRIFSVGNYCSNKELMEQRALHETLNRLLWRYSIEYDGKITCYGLDYLYEISYNITKHEFEVMWTNTRIGEGVVYFKKQETARNAIKEVIEPFLEKHPEFHYFQW